MSEQKILVIPRGVVDLLGPFDGFRTIGDAEMDTIGQVARYMPRDLMENDPSWKQLIPYVILRSGGKIFTYRRGKLGSESRLHNLRSLGVGGHVDEEDHHARDEREVGKSHASWNAVERAAIREIREEVGLDMVNLKLLGLINEDDSSVGKVHLGLAYEANIREDSLGDLECCLVEPRFEALDTMDLADYELWSQIAAKFLAQHY